MTCKALNDIELTAGRGMTLAIVGESGCGKSTFAKVLTGIEQATGGSVKLERHGDRPDQVETRRRCDQAQAMQMVFQNPDSTLNPSHSRRLCPVERALRKLTRHQRPRGPCRGRKRCWRR